MSLTSQGRCVVRLASLALAWCAGLWGAGCHRTAEVSGPIPQEAYLWQRDWSTQVVDAVAQRGPRFARLVYLAGEISWNGSDPRWTRVAPDYGALRRLEQAPGLALRVGPFQGPFQPESASTRFVVATALQVLAEAREHGLNVSEFQLDFDCASRNLDGYRAWLAALRPAIAPVPLRITALPAWLKERSFAPLAQATDGYVLQVHSVKRPRSIDEPFTLCDPAEARAAVERAARIGVPFRVALPTYGYLAAFDPAGAFLGASAEGPGITRPAGTRYRELNAPPEAMAWLVSDWTRARPAAMEGILWYRLPVEGDRLNWRWVTMQAVMEGRIPVPNLVVESLSRSNGALDLVVRNTGAAPYQGAIKVHARWNSNAARDVAADGVRGFRVGEPRPGERTWESPSCRLPPGDTAVIGWLRLDASEPISLELDSSPPSPIR